MTPGHGGQRAQLAGRDGKPNRPRLAHQRLVLRQATAPPRPPSGPSGYSRSQRANRASRARTWLGRQLHHDETRREPAEHLPAVGQAPDLVDPQARGRGSRRRPGPSARSARRRSTGAVPAGAASAGAGFGSMGSSHSTQARMILRLRPSLQPQLHQAPVQPRPAQPREAWRPWSCFLWPGPWPATGAPSPPG